MTNKIHIKRYNPTQKYEWDNFMQESKNGLFFFERDFMDYHSDRFKDHSLMIYSKSTLLAVFPANENENIIYSHQGLTFGSLLLSKKAKTKHILIIFEEVKKYYTEFGFSKIIYKSIPYIFHKYPSQEDLYVLYRNNAQIVKREISSVIKLKNKIEYTPAQKRQAQKLSKTTAQIVEEKDFSNFWKLLNDTLKKYHNTAPVHTLEEIMRLKYHFPKQIKVFSVYQNDEILAGVLLFDFGKTIHNQYIASSEKGRKTGALAFLHQYLIQYFQKEKNYYSFGISTENGGLYLNEGLIRQKEEMGGRGVVLDTYEIILNQ